MAIPIPIGEALITGGSGLLSALLGFKGSKYSADKSYRAQLAANEANLTAVRETNEANYRQWQEYAAMQKALAGDSNLLQRQLLDQQQRFSAAEAQKERNYNSASAQVMRMINAGLNPSSASAGTSAAMGSVGLGSPVTPQIGPPPQSVAGHVEPAADIGYGEGLKSVAQALGSVAALSNSFNISREANRSAESIAAARRTTDERMNKERLKVQEAIANQSASIQYDAQQTNEKYTNHLIDVGNKQIAKMDHDMKMDSIARQQADEQLLINWFTAKSGANLNNAMANQATQTALQISWLTQNQLPKDLEKTEGVIQQIAAVTEGLKDSNIVNRKTLNARINEIINKSDMSNTSRLLMTRAFRNLTNLDTKQYLQVLNSVLTFFGGSGITPGYSVK